MKINKNLLLIAALIVGTIGFTNCGGGDTKTNTAANNSNKTVATTNTATPANTTTPANTEAPKNTEVAKTTETTGDKIGVPECDEYIEKYEACLNSKVPEAQRAMFKSSFETMRKTWKESAANPQAKAALATGCKQAIETAKTSMSSFACTW